jgi:hypothetical protein
MAWIGRYKKGYAEKGSELIPGGRPFLILLLLFVALELAIEISQEIMKF